MEARVEDPVGVVPHQREVIAAAGPGKACDDDLAVRLDRHRAEIREGAGPEEVRHLAARPEGGVERAARRVAGERERVARVRAGDHDLPVRLDGDRRGGLVVLLVREARRDDAAAPERRVERAVRGEARHGEVAVDAVRAVKIGLVDAVYEAMNLALKERAEGRVGARG